MFADLALSNRFVALVALLVSKDVFTLEEFEETANAFEANLEREIVAAEAQRLQRRREGSVTND